MTTIKNNIITRDYPPEPTLRRLPWYLAYVDTLKDQGVEHVSSTTISSATGVDSSQIAKDLSVLGIKGKTRIGYDVDLLQTTLRSFLGFNIEHSTILIGAGSLGQALIADTGLRRFGLNIVAGFDINPEVVGKKIHGVEIHHIDSMATIQKSLAAPIAIIAVPAAAAQDMANRASAAGVKALWNFTPCRLHTAPGTVVQNTSIYAHLAVMYNRLIK